MLGQETGHKEDPPVVAHDMCFARNNEATRLFSVKEFLTTRQIQSYFSRRAARLRCQESSNRWGVCRDFHAIRGPHALCVDFVL